ncbi:MAG: D-aminopeptidase [Solirubrobacterales bacterium]|nr:D-aminopeptidase [Solirubrobacterales bacterium]
MLIAADMEGITGIDECGDCLLSEVRVYAQALAAEGVLVLVVAGDRWMLDELDEGELGSARLVETKEGDGRAKARSRDVAATHAELAEAIGAAISEPLHPPPARQYPAELRIAIATVFRTSQVSREYRQLAKLLPAGYDSRLRAAQRRLGSLLATPVMRAKERRWLDQPAPP